MSRIWQCTIDTFGDELGPMSRLAVSVRLDYIKRVETDHTNEEKLLRQLLDRLRNTNLSTPRVMLNLAQNLRKQGKHEKAERTARDVLLLLGQHQIYSCRTVERIESLKVVSHSQFDGGKVEAAAQTIEEAIQMIKDHLGNEHPWVTEFKTVLEDKVVDADNLQREIDKLMKKDSTEEDLTVFN
ncbi:uncharacterized protein PpBr36_10991 [Pyricularia pennisetigena]|uniref:uncharacterized protein n=1 Tax=Pyricularia pennisetigena TaxID=1578925 RepID=UPI00114FE715|nr:uncharacterized protein PpBr36_10991 [Pyricularia pennisetigena]TLS20681.1 hypothetical protein PpBr36_10991 [Pyricularia pennisetigena]